MSKQSHINNLFNQSGCLSLEALEQYKDKSLNETDRKAADEHLSECIMCNEALEGLAMMAEKPGSAFYTNRINTRLRKSHAYTPLRARKRNTAAKFSRLLVPAAASIILLMSIIAYFQFFYPTQQELAILESPELIEQSPEASEMPDQQKTSGSTEQETQAAIPVTRQIDEVEEITPKESSKELVQEPGTASKTTVGGIADRSEQEDEKLPPPSENLSQAIIAEEEVNSEMEIFGGTEKELVIMDLDEEVIEVHAPSPRKKDRGVKQDDDMLRAASKSSNSESPKSLKAQKEEADTTFAIFTVVEKMPEFPGGEDSLAAYIQRNMVLPDIEDAPAAGKAYVSFIVNVDGKVSDVVLLRSFWDVFDDEAIRLIKEMPAWIPGTQRGQPVRVQYILPVKFIKP